MVKVISKDRLMSLMEKRVKSKIARNTKNSIVGLGVATSMIAPTQWNAHANKGGLEKVIHIAMDDSTKVIPYKSVYSNDTTMRVFDYSKSSGAGMYAKYWQQEIAPKPTVIPRPHLNMDVTQELYEGSAEVLDKFLGDGKLQGKGSKFIDMQGKYGINATFLTAIVWLESANGKSQLAMKNNNFGGMRGAKGWLSFPTVDDGIEAIAKNLKQRYIDKGHTTIAQIHKIYAEDPNWSNLIIGRIHKMRKQAESITD
jgi:hypothetical protein